MNPRPIEDLSQFRIATVPISYAGDPSSMEELADRVGELKAAKSDLDAYLERLKALFVASGRDEAEGVLFRVVLSAESVAPSLAARAPARESRPEIKDRGPPTRSSGGRSSGWSCCGSN